MGIEKLKNKIGELPESEKEAIMKMGELSEEELEKTVGGLSEETKGKLIVAGIMLFLATGSALALEKKNENSSTTPPPSGYDPNTLPPPYDSLVFNDYGNPIGFRIPENYASGEEHGREVPLYT